MWKFKSHLDFENFVVDFVHAFDLGEPDGVPILEAMTDFVQAGDDTLSVPGNAGEHGRQGLLAVCVRHHKVVSKVAKHLRFKAIL